MAVVAANKTDNTAPLEAGNNSLALNTSDATDTDVESIKFDDKEPWPTVKEFDSMYNEFLIEKQSKCAKEISLCMLSYRSNLYPSHLPVDVALVELQKQIDKLENSQKKSLLKKHASMVWNCLEWFQDKREKLGCQMQTPVHYKAQFNSGLIANTQPQQPIATTNNAVQIDYIDEPLDEYAQLYDFVTGKQLICTNKHNIEDLHWLSKFKTAALEDKQLNLNQQINVAEQPIPFLSSSEPFSHDDHMVYSRDLEATCKVIVHYSTYVHILLSAHHENTVIISCLRGRSRSPCIILSFLILFRGFNTQRAINFLSTAFRQQRPTMALLSSRQQKNFPNLSKYLNVCNHLEKSKFQLINGNVSENNWLGQAITEVWAAFLQHAPHVQNRIGITAPMASLKLTFEAQWQTSLSKLKYDGSGLSNKSVNGVRNESSVVAEFHSKGTYINCIKCSVPNVRDSGVFFPTTEIGFNMKNFNIYGHSCMRLCDQLKRNSLIFHEVVQPLVDEKDRTAPVEKMLASSGKRKKKVASGTKTKKRKTSATKQAKSTGHSYSIAKNKKSKSKSKSSSLPTAEITVKTFRKYFGCNDFCSKIKLPNSNLPLPWMYVYVSVRGAFRAALGDGAKIKEGNVSRYADVYWHFNVKSRVKRFRSLVEVKKYFMESNHKELLKDNGLGLMFNNKACMKLKCCVLHCVGSKPIHPYSLQYKAQAKSQKLNIQKGRVKKYEEPRGLKGMKQSENKNVQNGRLTNHAKGNINAQNARIAEHDEKYNRFARKYLEELSMDEVKRLRNGDYVYAFYPGTKLKDRQYGRYKILSNVKLCSSENVLLQKNTMDGWGMKLLWEPQFKSSRVNRMQFLVQQIRPAKLRSSCAELPLYDHNIHKESKQYSKTTAAGVETNHTKGNINAQDPRLARIAEINKSNAGSSTVRLNHAKMVKDSMHLSHMFGDDVLVLPLAHSGVDL